MSGMTLLWFLVVLVANLSGTAGKCVRVENYDMLEYSCVGGDVMDLRDIPENVEKIRITKMSIPRINPETFSRFGGNLWVLSCSRCETREIDPHAFRALENLQQLSLDSNRLTTVRASWFEGLNYLTYLDLNYNEIDSIEDGVYQNLPSLVDFRVSGNRLNCLNTAAMSHLHDLKRMFLGENPEFKCPNAVSKFLENHGVSFEKDPEWKRIVEDPISVEKSILPESPSRPNWETLPPFYWTSTQIQSEKAVTTPLVPEEATILSRESEIVNNPPVVMTESYVSTTVSPLPFDPLTIPIDDPWLSTTEPETVPPESSNTLYEIESYYTSGSPELAISSLRYQPVTKSTNVAPSYHLVSTESLKVSRSSESPDDFGAESGSPFEESESPVTEPSAPSMEPDTIRPVIPVVPLQVFQPSFTDDFYQGPYYAPEISRPPILENHQQFNEVDTSTVSLLELEAETDKPLPDCPRNSALARRPINAIAFSFLLLLIGKTIFIERL